MEMQTPHTTDETQRNLWDLPAADREQGAVAAGASGLWQQSQGQDDPEDADRRKVPGNPRLGPCEWLATAPPGFALPKNKTITISVIGGPSKGLTHRLNKPHISIGRLGGGADIEIDDQDVSNMHCAVGVKDYIIRLCDLDSRGGTYVEDQRVCVAPLEHLAEFRVGSSTLLVTVLPARMVFASDEVERFGGGGE